MAQHLKDTNEAGYLTYHAKMIQALLNLSKTSMGVLSKSAVNTAARILLPGETPSYAMCANTVAAVDAGGMTAAAVKKAGTLVNGVVVVTDERVFFAPNLTDESDPPRFPLSGITSMDLEKGFLSNSALLIRCGELTLAVYAHNQHLMPLREAIEKAIRGVK